MSRAWEIWSSNMTCRSVAKFSGNLSASSSLSVRLRHWPDERKDRRASSMHGPRIGNSALAVVILNGHWGLRPNAAQQSGCAGLRPGQTGPLWLPWRTLIGLRSARPSFISSTSCGTRWEEEARGRRPGRQQTLTRRHQCRKMGWPSPRTPVMALPRPWPTTHIIWYGVGQRHHSAAALR
jgi:hypothetical protein